MQRLVPRSTTTITPRENKSRSGQRAADNREKAGKEPQDTTPKGRQQICRAVNLGQAKKLKVLISSVNSMIPCMKSFLQYRIPIQE